MKWFSRDKGWGFIRLESGDEIFVHHSDIEGEGFVSLEDDEPVEFTVEEMDKGPRARNVRSLAGGAADAGDGEAKVATASAPKERASAGRSAPGARPDRGGESAASDRSSGGLRPLAEQLRERLGRHFPGLGG